jgi:hypothetical protein
MNATPFSKQPYFPMILANGSDSVLIGYTGSMVGGLTGHSHLEQNQACPCEWYKAGHRGAHTKYKIIQPIVQSGYLVIVDGEVCDIGDYEQEFSPREAILTTRVSARGVRVCVEAFLTESHVLAERYHIEAVPRGADVQLAFFVRATDGYMGALHAFHPTTMKERKKDRGGIDFDYAQEGISGRGRLFADRRADDVYGETHCPGLLFKRVRKGFSAVKYLILMDPTDGADYRKQLESAAAEVARLGYAKLKARHVKRWDDYSDSSRISVPDADFQYLYDLSLYFIRAYQHPKYGGISCGLLPNLWSGGTHCPYDAFFAQRALLATNHVREGRNHLDYYQMQHPAGRKTARSIGLPGAVFSGWSDCFGKDTTANLEKYFLEYKPLMPAFIVLDAYWQWVSEPNHPDHAKRFPMLRDILDLAVSKFVIERGDCAYMAPCIAGNESAVKVENDTLNGLAYARTLAGYAEMAGAMGQSDRGYAVLAEKLFRGLESNYRDGVLMPYSGARYLTGLQMDFFLINLPTGINEKSITAALKAMKTPWGVGDDQPSEAYRDWPWWSSRAAIAYAHLRRAKQSFQRLTHPLNRVSSLGLLPEKIRMDGYVINYGFMTGHALFAWSLAEALCHDGPDHTIRLLWGLDGTWRDVDFENLRLSGGILASGTVRKGKLKELSLTNTSSKKMLRRINVNPIYRPAEMADSVELKAGKTRKVM